MSSRGSSAAWDRKNAAAKCLHRAQERILGDRGRWRRSGGGLRRRLSVPRGSGGFQRGCGYGWRNRGDGRRRNDRRRWKNGRWRRLGSIDRWAESASTEIDDRRRSHGGRWRCRRFRLRHGGWERRKLGLARRRSRLLSEACVRRRNTDLFRNESNDDEHVEQRGDAQPHGWRPTPAHEFPNQPAEWLHSATGGILPRIPGLSPPVLGGAYPPPYSQAARAQSDGSSLSSAQSTKPSQA